MMWCRMRKYNRDIAFNFYIESILYLSGLKSIHVAEYDVTAIFGWFDSTKMRMDGDGKTSRRKVGYLRTLSLQASPSRYQPGRKRQTARRKEHVSDRILPLRSLFTTHRIVDEACFAISCHFDAVVVRNFERVVIIPRPQRNATQPNHQTLHDIRRRRLNCALIVYVQNTNSITFYILFLLPCEIFLTKEIIHLLNNFVYQLGKSILV